MAPLLFADRLRSGARLLGTLVQIPHPEVALRLARQGFDWLFLDGEHGGYGPPEAAATLAALGGSVPCLLRVPSLDPEVLEAAAGCGVAGLILPHVDEPAQAEAAVRIIRGRGLVVVQAESGEALLNIGAIARVSGVDVVFIGPYDLSESLGIPEQFHHPVFREAVAEIARTCREARMPLGIFRMSAAEMRPHEAEGFTLLAVGLDGTLLEAGARAVMEELRA
ncbi:2,4-dihydroxyhept-2-ene-1,7-dioic acid aldolase [Geothrix limicola]|uniref:2,4-dihydroxyhept-2-ene-1,7-dioic acid aldolase n=1 Tax=Geothrix limicola TaxID=2927978 RepID=A0ABQ5QJQ4_9BACT|nr:aldolase/citrate lyase family protein [Geothrix limicola]GLH74249.1 2,4-dihydroxyhept-2-ene-1,7-dioic acid aldolase [Geothrix limicola]